MPTTLNTRRNLPKKTSFMTVKFYTILLATCRCVPLNGDPATIIAPATIWQICTRINHSTPLHTAPVHQYITGVTRPPPPTVSCSACLSFLANRTFM